MGASNVQWGLPVTSTGAGSIRAYKAAEPFQSLEDDKFYLEKALSRGQLREAVVSVDLVHFAGLGIHREWRRVVVPSDSLRRIAYDLAKLSLQPASLADALRVATWRLAPDYGRLNPAAAPSIISRGYDTAWPLFSRASGVIAARFATEHCLDSRFGFDWRGNSMYDQLADLARTTLNAGVRLSVVQLPQHLMMRETYDRLGVGRRYATWLRSVVALIADLNGGPLLRVVDFNMPRMHLDEGFPSSAADSVQEPQMDWWYDQLHFSPKLGALVVSDLERPDGPAIGVTLTPDNVERHLAEFEAYRKSAQRVLDANPASVMRRLRDRLRSTSTDCAPQSKPSTRVAGERHS
jgi:hypothetical protein